MDCPKCGVYNPEDRTNCWRCGAELPKPTTNKRRDPQARARVWLYVALGIVAAAMLMRMCGYNVPGMPSDSGPTGQAPTRPALVWVARGPVAS